MTTQEYAKTLDKRLAPYQELHFLKRRCLRQFQDRRPREHSVS